MEKQICNRKMFAAFLAVMSKRYKRCGYMSARAYAFRYICKFDVCLDYKRIIFHNLKLYKHECT